MLQYGFRGTTVGVFIQRNVHIFAFGWSEGPKMADEFKIFTDYILILFLAHLVDSPGVLLCTPNCATGKMAVGYVLVLIMVSR